LPERRDAAILEGYRGHVDQVGPVIAGWVSEIGRPWQPVQLIVVIDRDWRCPVTADRARADVAAAGLASAACGFSRVLPGRFVDGSEHAVQLLLPDGRDLNLPGLPRPCVPGPVRIELIAAGAAGLDAVLELLRRTDREAGFDPSGVMRENAAAFDAVGSHQGFLRYARAGERLVGYGRLDRGPGDAAGFGVVALTVLEAYRRKGIGDALLRAVLETAAAAGMQQVWLSVRPDNAPAIRLYDKLGFVRQAMHPPGPWAVAGEMTMVWTPR
jgi:ribosomal protein S18 acetylase RimI-like enzyme